MTPILFTALSGNRIYASASIGNMAIQVWHPRRDGGDDPFEFGHTDSVQHVGCMPAGVSFRTRGMTQAKPFGDRCACICAWELVNPDGSSIGEVLVAAAILNWSDMTGNIVPIASDPRWKTLAMRAGVVFTPDLT